MGNVIDIDKQIEEATKNLPDDNYMLGRTLMQPCKPANSGSRALMASIHTEHLLVLNNPEIPILQTGFETQFGVHSTSYVESKNNFTVINKVYKFRNSLDHYYLIIRDNATGEYDVIERTPCHYNMQDYGYLWNNKYIDNLNINDTIYKGDVIKKSNGFDDYGNKMNGANLMTMYLSSAQNMEDSVIISESAAKKLESSLVKNATITINDNDVLLNLYGDNNEYKAFPNIGESIKDGMFCSIRRVDNENILYSLSVARLKEPNISDRCILMNGIVADINVYCNNPEILKGSIYNNQLYDYYNQSIEFNRKIVEIVKPLVIRDNAKLSYKLNKLYSICNSILEGKQFFKDKPFSNVILEVTVIENLATKPGDKMADRYGGKGVISKIVPDELMPRLETGQYIECIKNQSTCINRENIGQLHEQSINFMSARLIEYLQKSYLPCTEKVKILHKYISMIDKDEAKEILSYVDCYDEEQCRMYLESIYEDGYICISSPPFTTPINIDLITQIYDEFPFLKEMYYVYTKMEGSDGNLREVKSNRKIVAAKIYNYRLKQYAKEKFSVTSLGAINLKGLNTRSKANKVYEELHPKTPVCFGNMEIADLLHLGAIYTLILTNMWANSSTAKRAAQELLIGDPFTISLSLDMYSTNRNAECINVLFKTMGIKIDYIKEKKIPKYMLKNVMVKSISNKDFKPKTNIINIINSIKTINQEPTKDMVKLIMVKLIDKK